MGVEMSELEVAAGDGRTARRILDAAGSFLVRHPRASLADVAAAAGVGRTTVHRHFPTREALVDALAVAAVERIESAIAVVQAEPASPREQLTSLVEVLLPLSDEFRLLEGNEVWAIPALTEAWQRIDAQLTEMVASGKHAGDFRPDLPTPVIIDALAGVVWSVGCGIADGRVAAKSAPADVLLLLLDGIGVR